MPVNPEPFRLELKLFSKVFPVIAETLNNDLIIKSDLAGERPVYLFFDDRLQACAYSYSLGELLTHVKAARQLEICNEGLSFLLQSGVIPPPKTIYKNLFLVGCGFEATIKKSASKLTLEFSYKFPFFTKERKGQDYPILTNAEILKLLADATIMRLEPNKDSFLFHSSGKDSNAIALALAEANYQNKVTLITQQTNGANDESELSKDIAKKLGFKHISVKQPTQMSQGLLDTINSHFADTTYPWTDFVSLSYPVMAHTIPELFNSNIIDGLGNDIYMECLPSSNELKYGRYASLFSRLRGFLNKCPSETFFNPLSRTPAEWAVKVVGLLYEDCKKMLPNAVDVYDYWQQCSANPMNLDSIDYKTELYGNITIAEVMIRKARNATDVWNANLVMPWADESIANYFSQLPEKYLTDRKNGKNKLFLRPLLIEKLDLDSDKIGKKGFDFDFFSLMELMIENVFDEILSCQLWKRAGTEKIVKRLYGKAKSNSMFSNRAKTMLHRIYLLSAWVNRNKYLKKNYV